MFKSTIKTKFLDTKIDKNLNWKNLMDQIVPNLGAACCTIRLFHTQMFQGWCNCILPFHNWIWNNLLGKFNQFIPCIYITKENH